MFNRGCREAGVGFAFLTFCAVALGQEVLPHAQDRPPNPPKTPTEAIAAMVVPDGFTVELVAGEPDIVNPVSMTIDERGRFWVTESLEYPRREPGPGRDRVKLLEDTNGDGKADRVTVFIDGLNIPSGVAVGHGGVWIANSPDILFVPDADRDGVADGPAEVVATGFGRDDTHELPNSLTWGPDGWLYGWNGVFNPSKVTSKNGKTYSFTCAIWRIHPRTREFQVFSEGTSNPWGIAINDDGEFFASACVIDHLWHMVEGAYYIRQGGPYPPFTYPAGSIVDHKHQKAAYCGIHWFDSDAYPEAYRRKLYMGNIHGNCINVDELERAGATYKGEACPDFLTANDAWFMPVVQKTGPDGSLYILDWYDRYHCYQDANRDPEAIDRLKGRLYRVRYRDTPRTKIDLAREPSARLFDLLGGPNDFIRETARRLLVERSVALREGRVEDLAFYAHPDLANVVFNNEVSRERRLNALWTLLSMDAQEPEVLPSPEHAQFYGRLLSHEDATFRAWGVRALRTLNPNMVPHNQSTLAVPIARMLETEESPIVWREVLINMRAAAMAGGFADVFVPLGRAGGDAIVRHLAWQALQPSLSNDGSAGWLAERIKGLRGGATSADSLATSGIYELLPRAVDRLVSTEGVAGGAVGVVVLEALELTHGQEAAHRAILDTVTRAIRQGTLREARLKDARDSLYGMVRPRLAEGAHPLQSDYVELAGAWGDGEALEALRARLADPEAHPAARLEALEILVSRQDAGVVEAVAKVLADRGAPRELRDNLFGALGQLEQPELAEVVIAAYPELHPQLKQRALVLLTERAVWGRLLLEAIGRGAVPKQDVNLNHLRKLIATRDPEISRGIQMVWGAIREGRNEKRDLVVSQMRSFIQRTAGDPIEGRKVFTKACAQCHRIYGQGEEVGPDITLNGRNDFEQLLSNVFDPNLVIGQGYQACAVAAADGRVFSGLLVEDSPERVVLKLQGGTTVTLARDEIEEFKLLEISLMPEELETQLTPQEIADLFAFLVLDKPPEDPSARKLPGAR